MDRTILICMAVFAFAGYVGGKDFESDGNSGDVCGTKVCLAGKASCVDNECKCNEPKYNHGKGVLQCYKKNQLRAEVTNDPRIWNYNNESFDLPFACRYLLTHVVTDYKDEDKNVVGSCEAMVFVFHHKAEGKFYVGGVQASFRIECNNGSRYEMAFQLTGTSSNNHYKYYDNSTWDAFNENGPWNNDQVKFGDSKTGMVLTTTIDKTNNRAEILAKRCGIHLVYRPYDPELKRAQLLVPGMTASVSCANKPTYESVDKVLATPPLQVHNGFTVKSIEIEGLGPIGTMLYRAYMSGVQQEGPHKNQECANAKTALEQCDGVEEVKLAIKSCQWIMTSTKLIRCYDKTTSGVDIQKLFNTCIGVFCGQPANECTEVVSEVETRGCLAQRNNYRLMDVFVAWCLEE